MSQIWLVRHAPTTTRGICYGQSDVPVAPEADAAAQSIAERWQRNERSDLPELWTSPWARTRTVAEQLARHWQIPYQVDERLSELNFGEWEGCAYSELERTDAKRWQNWLNNYEHDAPPGGETVTQLHARVAAWLAHRKTSSSVVLAITHAGVIRTARAIARGITYSAVAGDAVPHLCPERVL